MKFNLLRKLAIFLLPLTLTAADAFKPTDLSEIDHMRRVVELWEDPAKANENRDPEKDAAARKVLQSAFDTLGK